MIENKYSFEKLYRHHLFLSVAIRVWAIASTIVLVLCLAGILTIPFTYIRIIDDIGIYMQYIIRGLILTFCSYIILSSYFYVYLQNEQDMIARFIDKCFERGLENL